MPDRIILVPLVVEYYQNKPVAQATGADPIRCNSTNKQNAPINQNHHNFWTSYAIWMPFKIKNLQKKINIVKVITKSPSATNQGVAAP